MLLKLSVLLPKSSLPSWGLISDPHVQQEQRAELPPQLSKPSMVQAGLPAASLQGGKGWTLQDSTASLEETTQMTDKGKQCCNSAEKPTSPPQNTHQPGSWRCGFS